MDYTELRRLYWWLSYKRFSVFMYAIAFWYPTIAFYILAAMAILFTPYMLYVLFKSGKWRWIQFFIIVVGIPCAVFAVPAGDDVILMALRFLPLLAFYLYCFFLRLAVADWIDDELPYLIPVEEEVDDSHL